MKKFFPHDRCLELCEINTKRRVSFSMYSKKLDADTGKEPSAYLRIESHLYGVVARRAKRNKCSIKYSQKKL